MMGWPIRPAPSTPTVVIGDVAKAVVMSCNLEDDAFLRLHVHEDGAANRRTQCRVLARQQRPLADRDAEIDGLAKKDLLVHASLPDVVGIRLHLCQFDVLRPDRKRYALVRTQLLIDATNPDVANLGADDA